jgi:hypothetical protein
MRKTFSLKSWERRIFVVSGSVKKINAEKGSFIFYFFEQAPADRKFFR